MDKTKILRKFLGDPASYAEPTSRVEIRETAISEVYLTEHAAYKIKKPILLSYLDYSTLDARYKACLEELRLNRRFSSGVYQGLVAITQESDGCLAFDGRGPPVEYAVKMRRLNDSDMLDQRLLRGHFDSVVQERVQIHLSQCFQKASRVACGPDAYMEHLDQLVRGNWTSLLQLSLDAPEVVQEFFSLGSRQLLFLWSRERLFAERVRKGAIIEGHGDLRPEHVAIEEAISLIDGVEFNREFRVIDVADELSFLSMECAILGYESIGHDLRQAVLDRLRDAVSPELLAFYESYRALVRAKVSFLKAASSQGEAREEAQQQITLYRALARRRLDSIMPPFAFVITGAMGSGKTTLARALHQKLGIAHLETDAVRQQLYGSHSERLAYGEGIYSAASRRRVYEFIRQDMLDKLGQGASIIVDGSLSEPEHAALILDALRAQKHPHLVVVCTCEAEVAEARIRERQKQPSLSQARVELYREQMQRSDWNFQGHPLCRLQTHLPLNEQLRIVYRAAGDSVPFADASLGSGPSNLDAPSP